MADRYLINSPVASRQLAMNTALACAIASNSAAVGGWSRGAVAGGTRSGEQRIGAPLDALGVEAHHIPLTPELVDVLRRPVVAADDLGDAGARASRDEQQHALALGGIKHRQAAEPQSKAQPVGARGINRHIQAAALHVWYIGTCCPLQGLPRGRGMRPVPGDRVRTRTRPERHETESEEENADCNSE
jgi:hypothetical protein